MLKKQIRPLYVWKYKMMKDLGAMIQSETMIFILIRILKISQIHTDLRQEGGSEGLQSF